MNTRFFTISLVVVMLGLPTILLAQPCPPQSSDRQMMDMRMMDELKLTDQQKKDIDKIHTDAMKEQIDRRSQIAKARVELQELLRADSPNQSAIEKKMNDIAQMKTQAQTKRLNTWFSINNLLNADQQKVWKKVLERHAMLGNKMGMRGRMNRDGFRRPMGDRPMWRDDRGPRR